MVKLSQQRLILSPKKHYTIKFAKTIVEALQEVRVQRIVAKLFSTSEYTVRHKYATILIDKDKERVLNLVKGRKGKSIKLLFFELNEEEYQPQIKRVNIDMWKPYMNTMRELSPKAKQVHNKFLLIKKLSEAIDKTRKKEIKEG